MPDTSTRKQWFLKKFCFLSLQKRWVLHSFTEPQIYGPTRWLMGPRRSNSFNCISKLCYTIQPCNNSCPWDHFSKALLGNPLKMVWNWEFSFGLVHTATFQTFSLQVDFLCVRLVESSSRIRILLKRKFWLLVQYLPEKTLVLFFCWYKKTPFLLLLFLIIRPIFSYNVSYTKVF